MCQMQKMRTTLHRIIQELYFAEGLFRVRNCSKDGVCACRCQTMLEFLGRRRQQFTNSIQAAKEISIFQGESDAEHVSFRFVFIFRRQQKAGVQTVRAPNGRAGGFFIRGNAVRVDDPAIRRSSKIRSTMARCEESSKSRSQSNGRPE